MLYKYIVLYSYDQPLADAKLYQHRDICRILELNGGRDLMEDHGMVISFSSKKILFLILRNLHDLSKIDALRKFMVSSH